MGARRSLRFCTETQTIYFTGFPQFCQSKHNTNHHCAWKDCKLADKGQISHADISISESNLLLHFTYVPSLLVKT